MLKERSTKASRLVSLGVLSGALSVSLLGCGAPAAPAASPAPPVVSALAVSKEEPPDLAPVAAPPELFALARFKKPQTAIETVGAWANLPFKVRDVLPADLKGLEGVVAWDAPVEAAMALDPLGEGKVPEPLAVVSVGLTSLEGALDFARAKGQSVSRLRAGVYRIGESDDVSCAVGVALGSAPARLVCGRRAHDVDGLFNYATRGLPNEPLPNLDFQIELRLEPVKKKYQSEIGSARLLAGFLLRQVQVDNPRFDRALSDVAYSLVDESIALVHDLDKLRIDSNIDGAKNLINVRLALKFAGQKSWLVQASTESMARVQPAPELFWQLPADSSAASFGSRWKPERLKPIGHTLSELLDGFLESQKLPVGLRNQASKSVEALFDQNAMIVQAQGGLSEIPTDPLLAADYRSFGWQMVAFEGDTKKLLSLFDGLSATLASRDLERVLKPLITFDSKTWPKFSSHALQLRGFKPGAKAYRVDLPREVIEKFAKMRSEPGAAKGKVASKTAPLSWIVAYDGERSWVGMSPDETALIKRLESLKDPKASVLRSRAGLDALKGTPRAAGGFLTLARFAGSLSPFVRGGDADKLFTALPHHGETPIVFSYDLNPTGPELTSTFSVPRATVEDIGALAPAAALLAASQGSSVLSSP